MKYLIFDFDGTMVNTNDLIIEGLNQACLKYRKTKITQEEIVEEFGKPLREQMDNLDASHGEEMVEFYKEYYVKRKDEMTFMFEGVKEVLLKLSANENVKLAVLTNKGVVGLKYGLDFFGIKGCFEYTLSCEQLRKAKPDREGIDNIIDVLGGDRKDYVMIGDSVHDIECGNNAGVKTALVDWTVIPKEKFENLQVDYLISRPDDFLLLINED